MANFCFGVMPPSAILGRSLLYMQSHAVHSSVHNHFNLGFHFIARHKFKLNLLNALSDWPQLIA